MPDVGLGPVGGRIVAEVLIGLLHSDTESYLVQKPKWTPTLTSAGSSFRMKDFLTFAAVDPGTLKGLAPAMREKAQKMLSQNKNARVADVVQPLECQTLVTPASIARGRCR